MAFFSLQLVVPAMVDPKKSKIVAIDLELETLKVFLRIGKCFQAWANSAIQQSEGCKDPGPVALQSLFDQILSRKIGDDSKKTSSKKNFNFEAADCRKFSKAFEDYCAKK